MGQPDGYAVGTREPTAERWLPVLGYEGLYVVSDLGRVRSRSAILGGSPSFGYRVVSLRGLGESRGKNKKVHRLVLEAFVGPCPPGMETRHLNGNRDDNRLVNLQWGTKSQNTQDKFTHGTMPAGEKSGTARLSLALVIEIKRAVFAGEVGIRGASRKYAVPYRTVSNIVSGRTWKCAEVPA